MADQAQREELSDTGEHGSVAWATAALILWICKRRPVEHPAGGPHGGLEFHNKVYVRYMKRIKLRLWENVEFAQNLNEEKKPVLSGGAPRRSSLQNSCFRELYAMKNY
jgi:hypothetical protein